MARFYGPIGYGDSVEATPGVWRDAITEINYQGDVIRNVKQVENTDKVNDNVTLSNSISVVADQYAIDNFINIKYVRWAGVAWTVIAVEVRSPRLILTLGSVYNGPFPILVSPEAPVFDVETGELLITDQEGIIFKNADTDLMLTEEDSPYLVPSDDTITVVATHKLGYYFNPEEITQWSFTSE